jgi:hypothetical protein
VIFAEATRDLRLARASAGLGAEHPGGEVVAGADLGPVAAAAPDQVRLSVRIE